MIFSLHTFVVMTWKAIETDKASNSSYNERTVTSRIDLLINQWGDLFRIDFNLVSARCLPMRRKYYHCFRFDLGGDLFTNGLKLGEDRVIHIVHQIGLCDT